MISVFQETRTKLEENGEIIEIDESQFIRKYNVGCILEK